MVDVNTPSVLTPTETPAPAVPAPLPTHIGKYEVVAVLGSGAMGVVYKCRQPDLGRFVAVKVLGTISAADHDLRQRFLREARVAAQLQHPNTVRIYDVGVDGAHPYLVLEWVDGRPLDQLVGDPVLTVDGSLQVAFHVAQALHDAHEHGVVHRDVKPSNILIDQAGRPKLADFGLAKFVDGTKSLSGVGDLIGTPKYMSPEQVLLPSEEVDARTDVFSLGSVLYEMLTGRPPFDGPSPMAVLRELTDEEPAPPHEVRPDIPEEVSDICMKALAKDRDKRYPTAAAFADAIQTHVLHRWFGSPEVELLAGLPPLSTGTPVKHPWRWWQWGGLLALGVAAGAGLTKWWAAASPPVAPVLTAGPKDGMGPVIDLDKLTARGSAELVALPTVADPNEHRRRLQTILEDLAAAAKQRRDDAGLALLRARLLRRAGDFNGALDALAGVGGDSPPAAAERMMARYQWQGLLLGNLEDPLLRPKAPEAMKAEAKVAEGIDPVWGYAARLAGALSQDVAAARKMAEAPPPPTADRNVASDVAMLRADAFFRAAEAEYVAATTADRKPAKEAAQKRREEAGRLAANVLRVGVEADQNHFGLLFLRAASHHRRSIWAPGDGESRQEMLRRQRPAFDTALTRLRAATPLRGADHAVARMVLLANFGRHSHALDQLGDAMSLRTGGDPLAVYAAWLQLLNPPDGQLTAATAEAILRDLTPVFETPPEGAPAYYVRALANAAAGRWEDARRDVQQLARLVPNPSPAVPWPVRLWISHANGAMTRFLHAGVDVLWQMQLPTPVDFRISVANEVVRRASDPEICRQEGVIARDAAAIRAFVHFRLAKFHAEKSDRDGVYRHVKAALAEKVDDMHAGTMRDDEVLRDYNTDPDFLKLYTDYPPPG